MTQHHSRDMFYNAALNNELLRLIWMGYKEGYFLEHSDVTFKIYDTQNQIQTLVSSREEAQKILYRASKGRLQITAHIGTETFELNSTTELLEKLKPAFLAAFPDQVFSRDKWAFFLKVSEEAVKNEAKSLVDKNALDAQIADTGSILDYAFTLSPNESFYFLSRYAAYFGAYDMAFSKMRVPLGNDLATECAPEFGKTVPLILAALNRNKAFVNTVDGFDANQLIAQENPEAFFAWQAMLKQKGLSQDDYIALPIHPLSLKLYREKLEHLIKAGDFVIDEVITLSTQASLSFRSMIPEKPNASLMYKLPIPLQLTGYIRFINWAEISKGPQFSKVLAEIFNQESNFGGRLRLDRDLVAVSVAPDATANEQGYDPNYMSFIVRENQARDLPDGVITMPLATLFSSSSVDDVPVFIHAMKKNGVSDKHGAKEYFNKYTDMMLRSYLALYLRHGIMVEAHQQNGGITLKPNGEIASLHYHDIALAICTYKPIYLAAGHAPELLVDLPAVSDEIGSSARQFTSTVLVRNIFPIASIVASHFDIPQAELYTMVAENIRIIIGEERGKLTEKPDNIRQLYEKFYEDLEHRVLGVKEFTSRRPLGRLFQMSQTPSWGTVPSVDDASFDTIKSKVIKTHNPLYGACEGHLCSP